MLGQILSTNFHLKVGQAVKLTYHISERTLTYYGYVVFATKEEVKIGTFINIDMPKYYLVSVREILEEIAIIELL